jgi:hypothetical protein
MAFTDTHWKKVLKAIEFKVTNEKAVALPGLPNIDGVLAIVRDNWDLFADERKLNAYIAQQGLVQKKNERASKAAELAALDNEIKTLER